MPSDAKGKGLTKKVGGQPAWAWGAEVLGALLVFLWWRNRQAANAQNAQTALSTLGADTSGAGGTVSTGSSTVPAGGFLNTSAWLAAVLSGLGGTNYNDFVAWLNGNCVTSNTAVQAIQQAIQEFGLPPGFGTPPPITVCPSSGPAPPSGTPAPTSAPEPPSNIVREFQLIANPALSAQLLARGYNIFTFGNAQYYLPSQAATPGKGIGLHWISSPALANELRAAGYTIYVFGGPAGSGSAAEYYNPGQHLP